MTKAMLWSVAFVAGLGLVACSSSSEPTDKTDEPTASTESAATRCTQTALCIIGDVWSPKACACVPEKSAGGGALCGTKHCGAGQYCCNSSCGICAPVGSACIQIACSP